MSVLESVICDSQGSLDNSIQSLFIKELATGFSKALPSDLSKDGHFLVFLKTDQLLIRPHQGQLTEL